MNFENVSNKAIFESINERIEAMQHMIGDELYPEIMLKIRVDKCKIAQKRMKINHYRAISRIEAFIASRILSSTILNFDLNKLLAKKDRKSLKAIALGLEDVSYDDVRTLWHSELKDKFFEEKERAAIQRKLENKTYIFRHESTDKERSGFISVINDKEFDIVKKASEATEFPVGGVSDEYVEYIQKHILNQYFCEAKAIFTTKMKGRKTSYII